MLYRYNEYLYAVARGLEATQGDISRLLVVNLGPAWPQTAATLSDNVLEPFNYALERPPGLGIGSLGLLFTVCKAMHSWLTEAPDTVVVCFWLLQERFATRESV